MYIRNTQMKAFDGGIFVRNSQLEVPNEGLYIRKTQLETLNEGFFRICRLTIESSVIQLTRYNFKQNEIVRLVRSALKISTTLKSQTLMRRL